MRERLITATTIVALIIITIGAALISSSRHAYNDTYIPEEQTISEAAPGESPNCEAESAPDAFMPDMFDNAQEAADIPTVAPISPKMRLVNVTIMSLIIVVGALLFHTRKSHRWLLGLMTVTIVYFGFIHHGCICPVGSTGHIANAISHIGELSLSVEAILLFFIPLIVALFLGRIFCSSACPLGAIQAVIERFNTKIPRSLLKIFGLGRWIVLIWVVVAAITAMTLPVCQYDPFVKIFRLSGTTSGWIYTFGFILLCITIKRPFCRFLCPYSVLLGIFAKMGFKTRKIIADKCVSCKKCVKVCPVECIELPKIDSFNCICCGKCSKVCPTDAIK